MYAYGSISSGVGDLIRAGEAAAIAALAVRFSERAAHSPPRRDCRRTTGRRCVARAPRARGRKPALRGSPLGESRHRNIRNRIISDASHTSTPRRSEHRDSGPSSFPDTANTTKSPYYLEPERYSHVPHQTRRTKDRPCSLHWANSLRRQSKRRTANQPTNVARSGPRGGEMPAWLPPP